MLIAVFSVTFLGIVLGLILGLANRIFHVEGNAVVAEIEALMPGSNCGQCGFPGCAGAAAAIVDGSAALSCCPPGGKALAAALSAKLGIPLDRGTGAEEGPKLASVIEDLCIGCTRCLKVCPTDALMGGPKQIHNVLQAACNGCGNCVERCPTIAIVMKPVAITLPNWVWPKPAAA